MADAWRPARPFPRGDRADDRSRRSRGPPTAEQALARLIAGNRRFVRGHARFPTLQKQVLAELAKGQRPYSTILVCSDSRVPPELLFDAGFGELFDVLGHEGCGAVEAALAAKLQGTRQRARIALLLRSILPRLKDVDAGAALKELLDSAVEANVRWSMHQVLATPKGRARIEEGVVRLIGAVYELKTGRVRFLS